MEGTVDRQTPKLPRRHERWPSWNHSNSLPRTGAHGNDLAP